MEQFQNLKKLFPKFRDEGKNERPNRGSNPGPLGQKPNALPLSYPGDYIQSSIDASPQQAWDHEPETSWLFQTAY